MDNKPGILLNCLTYVTLWITVVATRTTKICVMSTQDVYAFRTIFAINSDYFFKVLTYWHFVILFLFLVSLTECEGSTLKLSTNI